MEIETAASQQSQTNLSLVSNEENEVEAEQIPNAVDAEPNSDSSDASDIDSVDEFIIHVKGTSSPALSPDKTSIIIRQPSTTEYLRGMVTTDSPAGLLPQFPSWSLICIGPSSVYSHNTGLPEHVQSGFMSGSNFLLPWDVHVRLENAATWAASYEKSRSRKKGGSQQQVVNADPTKAVAGQVFTLKIFIGCEYECPRGHRFILNSPDQVLRGGSGKFNLVLVLFLNTYALPCLPHHKL